MKKPVLGLFVLALLFPGALALMSVNLVTANFTIYLPYITIKSDGSIEPQTEYITKNGNVYFLTADLPQKCAITIQCSNIVFDGQGHFINGSVSYAGYANVGITLDQVSNVLVKNVQVFGFANPDIALIACSQCSLSKVYVESLKIGGGGDNTIVYSSIGMFDLLAPGKNRITRNNITDILTLQGSNDNVVTENTIFRIFFWYMECQRNVFLQNNFLCGNHESFEENHFDKTGIGKANSWDNGSVGNYWLDYNGTDADGDGIGDTPYFIKSKVYDKPNDKVMEIISAQDNYPLIKPFILPSPTPEPISTQEPEPFPAPLVALACAVSVVVIGLGLFLHSIRRKN